MQRLRNIIAAALGTCVVLLAASLLTERRTEADDKKGSREFYLTQLRHLAGEATTACAGFHMASMWEILDPSNLRYNTNLGFMKRLWISASERVGAGP